MYNIDIICVGKLKEDYLRGACAEYSKRLSAFCKLKITELTPARIPDDPSKAQIDSALADEGKRIYSSFTSRRAFTRCALRANSSLQKSLAAILSRRQSAGAETLFLLSAARTG